MKINWGTGIVLAFIAFISFIMYFVITMSTNDKYDHDLVTEQYYKKELAFQKQINKEQKTKRMGFDPSIQIKKNSLVVSFPDKIDPLLISGTVFLYRPSNKKLDFEMPITLSGSDLTITNQQLLDGRWNIEIDWTYKGEEYFYKQEITF